MDQILETQELAEVMSDEQLIAAATDEIRAACGWHVAPSVAETLTTTGDGSNLLILRTLHVTAVSAVRVDDVVVDAGGYRWSEDGQLVRLRATWPAGAVVEVDLVHGWAPAEVRNIKGLIAAMVTRAKATKNGLIVRAQAGQVSRGFSQVAFNQAVGLSLTEHERTNVLAPYRLQQQP